MEKIKMICINDLIDKEGVWYKIGDFYEYQGLPSFVMFKVFDKDDGTTYLTSKAMRRENLYNYFMPYNEWLALQRENQIKSVIDD
jgi:hypothetical protein